MLMITEMDMEVVDCFVCACSTSLVIPNCTRNAVQVQNRLLTSLSHQLTIRTCHLNYQNYRHHC